MNSSKSSSTRTGEGLFYGWYIVAVMGMSTAASMAMGSLNSGLFINPMGDELGIGRSTFGWAQSARQVASSVTSPTIGKVLDLHGARLLLPVAAAIAGIGLILLSRATEGWQIIALFGLMGLVGLAGPGALVTSVPVVKWFVRKRARAIAFASLGIPVGALVFVPLTQVFIDAWGWRTAWIVLAVLGMGLIIPAALILLRRQPEDIGLLPDGDSEKYLESGEGSLDQPAEISWTLHEARRTFEFWKMVIMFSGVALAVGTLAVHRIPAFVDRGVDPGMVALATALDAVAAGLSTFAMGIIGRRLPVGVLGFAGFGMLAIASVITIYATSFLSVLASMVLFGFGIGGMMFMQNFIWAEFFGRDHLGAIRGFIMPITLIIGGSGAPIAGYVSDSTGSYDPIWWTGVVIMAASAILGLTLRAPVRS